jgi:uncharacterized membrane protein YccC
MDISIPQLQRFIFGHHFYSGIRRAAGALLPVLVLGLGFNLFAEGLVASFGALCIAFIDQPGPHHNRLGEMLRGAFLSSLAVIITGLASNNIWAESAAVVLQCFGFSLLSVYGKKGTLIGFACLLLMTVTLHSPLSHHEVWTHTLISLSGALFYAIFSYFTSRLMSIREKEQALAIALFATADYLTSRGNMYSADSELDSNYRHLITRQADMIEKHQGARDMVLRGLSNLNDKGDRRRIMLWNLFIEMLAIVDTMVATQADYALLQSKLGGKDILLFMHDALFKMALDLDRIALAVARNRIARSKNSVKAELRAIEFDVKAMQQNGFAVREPDAYSVCLQILKRLRHNANLIERMYVYTRSAEDLKPLDSASINDSLSAFLSTQKFNPRQLTSNLHLGSPFCRYALRVALGSIIALAAANLIPGLMPQGYWILLTVIIIMRPGFALTKQRNGFRLSGTIIGCSLALAAVYFIESHQILAGVMVLALIIGCSLILVNFMAAAAFNTLAMLIAFFLLNPADTSIIGMRAIDTIIGCCIAYVCSYFLPWWEAQFMPALGRAVVAANEQYLIRSLALVDLRQKVMAGGVDESLQKADFDWRLARKNLHVALSNFAQAFYRMMAEPKSQQRGVAIYNGLMIQCHMLASQTTSLMTILSSHESTPESVKLHVSKLLESLKSGDNDQGGLPSPPIFAPTGLSDLNYPLNQIHKSILAIVRFRANLTT